MGGCRVGLQCISRQRANGGARTVRDSTATGGCAEMPATAPPPLRQHKPADPAGVQMGIGGRRSGSTAITHLDACELVDRVREAGHVAPAEDDACGVRAHSGRASRHCDLGVRAEARSGRTGARERMHSGDVGSVVP